VRDLRKTHPAAAGGATVLAFLPPLPATLESAVRIGTVETGLSGAASLILFVSVATAHHVAFDCEFLRRQMPYHGIQEMLVRVLPQQEENLT
jgi:hypothetical protein